MQSELPKVKSIKKVFFENPGLFFYVEECACFFKILNDVNFFRRLISSNNIYEILSQLHMYPKMIEYYKDYKELKGSKALVACLERYLSKTNYNAVVYSAMNDLARWSEQIKWKNRSFRKPIVDDIEEYGEEDYGISVLPQPIKYSILMHAIRNQIHPCIIDGYLFKWLVNSNDYTMVGTQLSNCLKRWESWQHPVIAIFKDNIPVAAVEVNIDRYRIIQAHTAKNGYIRDDSPLAKAYEKWKKRYRLEERTYF